MAGITFKNLEESGGLARNLHYGLDFWVPPADSEYICKFQPIEAVTADADFTLNPTFVSQGQVLPWPQRVVVVVQNNRTSVTGRPGVVQANPNISGGTNAFQVVVTGKLNGKARSETLTINIGTLSTPGSSQLSWIATTQIYDEITSIRHQAKTTVPSPTWGSVNNLRVGAGVGVGALGVSHLARPAIHAPLVPISDSELRALFFPRTGEAYTRGGGTGAFSIDAAAGVLNAPSRPRDFDVATTVTVTTTSAARTVNLTAHGFTTGTPLRVRPIQDGLPSGLTTGTTYYVVAPTTNAFMLAADPIPRNFTTQNAAETLTLASHGLANGTPVLIRRALNAGVLTTIPAPLAEDTVYFVVNTAANTIQLEATVGGGVINITGADTTVGVVACVPMAAAGLFATGESMEVLRPRATWEQARLIYSHGRTVEKIK